MDYLPLFLLFAAALIAGWFYLQRAKRRDAGHAAASPSEPTAAPPAQTQDDRPTD